MAEFETKDSGQHAEYASGMRRDTQEGRPRFALILTKQQPYEEQMLTRYAALLARGAVKYKDRNWEEGDSEEELERAKDSLLRHMMQLLAGETDEDHAAAVWFNTQAVEYFRWRIAQKPKIEINLGANAKQAQKTIESAIARLSAPPKVVVGSSETAEPWPGAEFQSGQEVYYQLTEDGVRLDEEFEGRIIAYLPQGKGLADQFQIRSTGVAPKLYAIVPARMIRPRTS